MQILNVDIGDIIKCRITGVVYTVKGINTYNELILDFGGNDYYYIEPEFLYKSDWILYSKPNTLVDEGGSIIKGE